MDDEAGGHSDYVHIVERALGKLERHLTWLRQVFEDVLEHTRNHER